MNVIYGDYLHGWKVITRWGVTDISYKNILDRRVRITQSRRGKGGAA